jgi:hypothetical protein
VLREERKRERESLGSYCQAYQNKKRKREREIERGERVLMR